MARILLAEDDDRRGTWCNARWARRSRGDGYPGRGGGAGEAAGDATRFDVWSPTCRCRASDGVAWSRGLAINGRLRIVLMSGFADELDRAPTSRPGSAHHHQAVHAGADPLRGEAAAGVSGTRDARAVSDFRFGGMDRRGRSRAAASLDSQAKHLFRSGLQQRCAAH